MEPSTNSKEHKLAAKPPQFEVILLDICTNIHMICQKIMDFSKHPSILLAGFRFNLEGAPVSFYNPEDTFNFSPDSFLLRPFTVTGGAIFAFPFAPELNFTIYYWDIILEGAIGAVSGPAIVDLCFQTFDLNSPFLPGGGGSYR